MSSVKILSRALSILFVMVISTQAADRPNIVWIVSEDNSIHYHDQFFAGGAKTPNIETLATHGLTFDHAFSNAPVCSVARTTLATGCYAPRIGTQFHRRYQLAAMPEGLRMFPAYLRNAGYYATNNSKKDYNAIEGEGVWDESSNKASWRNRPDPDQPFFHMQSHAESHESSLHFGRDVFEKEKTVTDPASVQLADYHPDTPIFRYTHARYHDRIQAIDKIVGQTVAKLKEDGLLEDTFVFYFGDHGGVLPRGKGYLYESGLHVPLVVRVPEKFKHLVDGQNGSRVDGFVSFIDFGPTTLHLAGVHVPDQVDGKPFLGKGIAMAQINSRDETFGYADRFDEKYDLVRSLRKGKYQYIRNYQPYLPDGLQNNYRYKSLAYQEWRDLFKAGKLRGAAKQFFGPKQVEHLYDCEADPHQVNNLASDPRFADVLTDLRKRLQDTVKQLPDLSFYPESYLADNAMDNPVAFGQTHQAEIATLVDTADLSLLPFAEAEPKLREALKSDHSMIRYWAAMACTAFGDQAKSLAADARPLLTDPSLTVRIRAAEFLGLVGETNPQTILTEIVNTTDNAVVATEALNSVVWFRDFFDGRYPVTRSDFHPISKGADIDDRLNYINGVPYPPKTNPPRRRQGKPVEATK
ncbi:sulfatase-like hydrolase/transferase [Novipirellula artificiosorum]|nr:sulfatase-like hydrolase/transferase [Novipirellula artificiosorum]